MFEAAYVRPRWYRAAFSGGSLTSVAIHVGFAIALVTGGHSIAEVHKQVTEGIVFLAPLPSPVSGPAGATRQLQYVEPTSLVAAMTVSGSDLHVAAKLFEAPPPLEETIVGPPAESAATIFERPADSVYFAEQVDSPAAYDQHSAAPAYPDSLQRAGIEGTVMAQFVVDTSGRVEMESVKLLESSHLRFTESVLAALPRMLFRPAVLNGQKARQVVEVPFRFRVVAAKDTMVRRDTAWARPPR
jgi:TonB family protein